MVQGYYEHLFEAADRTRSQRFEAASSRDAMRRLVDECRQSIRSLYSLPDERTPLNTRSAGEIRHDGYRIEKLIFESRPGFLVTANVYVPGGTGPFPCVLGICGHSESGKAEEKYQRFCAGLAERGFLTLIYDPIGQGERKYFERNPNDIKGCVAEHIVIGTKLALTGDYFGSWRAWDAIRALDVLLSRSDVDTTRVGATGNSGGGTMTTILTALEDRLTIAVPSCFITTYRHNLYNELPADTEQIPPAILAAGYELYDHITASAPRPTLICAKEDDFFDVRGTREAYENLSYVYELLGAGEDIELLVGAGGHGFDRELREGMYSFFCRHAGLDPRSAEEECAIHSEEELACTDNRNVFRAGSSSVFDFVKLSSRRTRPGGTENAAASGDGAESAKGQGDGFSPGTFADLLKLNPDEIAGNEPPPYRVLRNRYGTSRFLVHTEPCAHAILAHNRKDARFSIPKGRCARIHLPHVELPAAWDAEPLLRAGEAQTSSFVVSVRGSGESVYDTCGGEDYFALYDADYFYSAYGILLDKPLPGRRVFDLLSTVRLLESVGYDSFELTGRGCGALLALYTAPFIRSLTSIRLENSIESMGEIVESETAFWPQSVIVPGMLEHFDLPEIVEYLRAKEIEVAIADPWGTDPRSSSPGA